MVGVGARRSQGVPLGFGGVVGGNADDSHVSLRSLVISVADDAEECILV